jgi:SAM-dependent methyltransferase
MSRPAGLGAVGAAHGALVFGRRVRVLADALAPLLPAGHLLDVGSGDGRVSAAIAARRPDVRPEGFDVLLRPSCAIPARAFDGRHLPLADGEADAALLVDVLHHADDPVALLAECARAARVVVVKDHLSRSRFDERVLAFMDWVGNRPHGVVLPYAYFSPGSWERAVAAADLREERRDAVPGLYPFPFSALFGRGLHFVSRLVRP